MKSNLIMEKKTINEDVENKSDLLNDLLNKCEASNIPMIYKKYLSAMGGVCTFDKLFKFNQYFSPNTILKDIEKIDDIIIVKVVPYALLRLKNQDCLEIKHSIRTGKEFELIHCIVNRNGLAQILNIYLKQGYIPKYASIQLIQDKLCISADSYLKFQNIIKDLIRDRNLFAVLIKNDKNGEILFKYTGKFLHPSNKRIFNGLIILIGVAIITITLLIITIGEFIR